MALNDEAGAPLHVARLVLRARDPVALAAFYRDAFAFVDDGPAADVDATLRLGATRLAIAASPGDAAGDAGDVPGWSPLFQHFAIRVTDIDAAMARLRTVGGWRPISTAGPERLPAGAGGVTAFKFRDPEGHPLELIAFPDQPPGALFVGIDHTAISVADVALSIAFYERLGFVVGARSLNQGIAQSRMDGLDDATVDVVTLRLPSGSAPHLELLGYRGRFDRAAVAPSHADDVVATRIVLAGGARAADASDTLLRDPDGHWLVRAS